MSLYSCSNVDRHKTLEEVIFGGTFIADGDRSDNKKLQTTDKVV